MQNCKFFTFTLTFSHYICKSTIDFQTKMYKTTLHHEHWKLNLKKKSCAILGKNANDNLCIFPYIDEKYDYKERDIIRWKTVVLDENIA